jgi:hypothetical protein
MIFLSEPVCLLKRGAIGYPGNGISLHAGVEKDAGRLEIACRLFRFIPKLLFSVIVITFDIVYYILF